MDLKNTVEDNFRLKASLDVLSKTIVIPNDKE
jgi:hypothetical protein